MNGFILVFGMVLVLAVERRFAADRALPAAQLAAGSPRPWAAAVPWPGARALADGKMLAKCVLPASDSGKISPRCVFGLSAMAVFRRDAFPGGDPWQLFRFMRSRRGLGREKRQFAATYRRHASKTSWLWQDMRAVHPKSPANGRSGMHRANILPGRGPFRCAGPSNHTRRADLAVVRRSPGAGPYA